MDLFDETGEAVMDKNEKRINELKNIIKKAKKTYYDGNPFLTDAQYDALEDELRKLFEDSGLDANEGIDVGAEVEEINKFPKAPHSIPMGSQDKCANIDEFEKWVRLLGIDPGEMVVNYKLDGSSLALYYEDGELIQAITRGNGKMGKDIIPNAKKFNGVLGTIEAKGFVAVRGEVMLSVENWKKVDPTALNPRNLGTGVMAREDGKECELLDFIVYDVSNDSKTFETEYSKINYLKDLGFIVSPTGIFNGQDEVIACYNRVNDKRVDSAVSFTTKQFKGQQYWIDGLVVKLDDIALQKKLGDSNGRPKWSRAMKFPTPGVDTKVVDVEFGVGHTGAITPVAIVKTVEVCGTNVSKVTLNNWDYIEAMDVAIGDRVRITKGGDIIPKLVAVLDRPASRTPIPRPTCCPHCKGSVRQDENVSGTLGTVIRCDNEKCGAKIVGKFKRVVNKLDILDVGIAIIEGMYHAGILRKIGDLFRIKDHRDTIKNLLVGNGVWGEKRTQTMIDEIEKKKEMTLDLFLGCLGIQGLGQRRAKIIMDNADGEMDTLDDWKSGKLIKIADKVGVPNIAVKIQNLIGEMVDETDDFASVISITEKKVAVAGSLTGKSFVLTGTMSRGRKEIAKDIEAAGGETHSSVGKTTSYLVQADPDQVSTKTKKAMKLGVAIIGEEELQKMIEGE